MKTALQQTTILYRVLSDSPLKSNINGDIYKNERPFDSTKEDVVANAITLTGSESLIQDGFGNVNIHLPNLANGLPNHLRFEELSSIATPLLEDFVADSYNFWTVSPAQLLKDEATGKWYMNIKLRFKFHNTN